MAGIYSTVYATSILYVSEAEILLSNMIKGDRVALAIVSGSTSLFPLYPKYPSHPSLNIRSDGSRGNHMRSIPVWSKLASATS